MRILRLLCLSLALSSLSVPAKAGEVLTIGERSEIPVQALVCYEKKDAENILLTHLKEGLAKANELIVELYNSSTGLPKCFVAFNYATIEEVYTEADLLFVDLTRHVTLNRGKFGDDSSTWYFLTVGPTVKSKDKDA